MSVEIPLMVMNRKSRLPADSMESSERQAQLEALHPDSFGWALVCCGHDITEAESTLQAVYLKVLSGKAVFERKSSLKTWLFGVIKKTAAERRRRKMLSRLRLVPLEDLNEEAKPGTARSISRGAETLADSGHSPDTCAYRNEMLVMFKAELAALPRRQREVLHLVFYQDLTLVEAAEVIGVSVGAARVHYDRGKKKLKARLIERGITSNAGYGR
jgi:RNA polymerase sigma-70 factor (ECF subfamily)